MLGQPVFQRTAVSRMTRTPAPYSQIRNSTPIGLSHSIGGVDPESISAMTGESRISARRGRRFGWAPEAAMDSRVGQAVHKGHGNKVPARARGMGTLSPTPPGAGLIPCSASCVSLARRGPVVSPGTGGLGVTNFYRSRYIFTQEGTPEGGGKVPGRRSTSSVEVSSEELLGPLNEIERKYAPPRLFVAGRLEFPLPHPRVAIVGTRTPSDKGRRIARKVAGTLARQGVIIVSGLARGIDTEAHMAAGNGGLWRGAVQGTRGHSRLPPQREARPCRRFVRPSLSLHPSSPTFRGKGAGISATNLAT